MSQTAVMTLTEFLTARLDEDEASLPLGYLTPGEPPRRGWAYPPLEARVEVRVRKFDQSEGVWAVMPQTVSDSVLSRMRAEVAAKRRIVAYALWAQANSFSPDCYQALDEVLAALASVYADHPDFDPAWA